MASLRDDLLRGRTIRVAGAVGTALRDALGSLGARVADDGAIEALVYDAREAFAGGGRERLVRALEDAWAATLEVATSHLLPAERGKVVLVAPAPDAGALAPAARAALENLARTLSVEWARYGVTVTMIAPGPQTTDDELAELVCYLASAAGDYFSGCRLELGAVA